MSEHLFFDCYQTLTFMWSAQLLSLRLMFSLESSLMNFSLHWEIFCQSFELIYDLLPTLLAVEPLIQTQSNLFILLQCDLGKEVFPCTFLPLYTQVQKYQSTVCSYLNLELARAHDTIALKRTLSLDHFCLCMILQVQNQLISESFHYLKPGSFRV